MALCIVRPDPDHVRGMRRNDDGITGGDSFVAMPGQVLAAPCFNGFRLLQGGLRGGQASVAGFCMARGVDIKQGLI